MFNFIFILYFPINNNFNQLPLRFPILIWLLNTSKTTKFFDASVLKLKQHFVKL